MLGISLHISISEFLDSHYFCFCKDFILVYRTSGEWRLGSLKGKCFLCVQISVLQEQFPPSPLPTISSAALEIQKILAAIDFSLLIC